MSSETFRLGDPNVRVFHYNRFLCLVFGCFGFIYFARISFQILWRWNHDKNESNVREEKEHCTEFTARVSSSKPSSKLLVHGSLVGLVLLDCPNGSRGAITSFELEDFICRRDNIAILVPFDQLRSEAQYSPGELSDMITGRLDSLTPAGVQCLIEWEATFGTS